MKSMECLKNEVINNFNEKMLILSMHKKNQFKYFPDIIKSMMDYVNT